MKLDEQKKKDIEAALRMAAVLFGAVSAILLAMVALLVLALFVEVGLPTAFMLQLLSGTAGGFVALWRTS